MMDSNKEGGIRLTNAGALNLASGLDTQVSNLARGFELGGMNAISSEKINNLLAPVSDLKRYIRQVGERDDRMAVAVRSARNTLLNALEGNPRVCDGLCADGECVCPMERKLPDGELDVPLSEDDQQARIDQATRYMPARCRYDGQIANFLPGREYFVIHKGVNTPAWALSSAGSSQMSPPQPDCFYCSRELETIPSLKNVGKPVMLSHGENRGWFWCDEYMGELDGGNGIMYAGRVNKGAQVHVAARARLPYKEEWENRG